MSEVNPSHPYANEERRTAVAKAFQALKALTPYERGFVLCWFCSGCGEYLEPGKGSCAGCNDE